MGDMNARIQRAEGRREREPEWRNVELNRNREDARNRLKEYAEEEYNRLAKEKGKKGEWEIGWGMSEEIERVRNGTIVECRRIITGNFLRNIWGGEEERGNKGKGKGVPSRGNWISGRFLRSTTRGVERDGEQS